jgi:hypothetical protein
MIFFFLPLLPLLSIFEVTNKELGLATPVLGQLEWRNSEDGLSTLLYPPTQPNT